MIPPSDATKQRDRARYRSARRNRMQATHVAMSSSDGRSFHEVLFSTAKETSGNTFRDLGFFRTRWLPRGESAAQRAHSSLSKLLLRLRNATAAATFLCRRASRSRAAVRRVFQSRSEFVTPCACLYRRFLDRFWSVSYDPNVVFKFKLLLRPTVSRAVCKGCQCSWEIFMPE